MSRILPVFLILLLVACAWRRDAGVPKPAAPPCTLTRSPGAPDRSRTAVAGPRSSRVPDDRTERERQLMRQVGALEEELRNAWERIDAHRARLARMARSEGEAQQAILLLTDRILELEVQLEVLEIRHVERALAQLRSQ